MKLQLRYLFALTTLVLAGCNGSDSDDEDTAVCTQLYTPGIVITVLDNDTQEAISCGVTATLQESSYEEELTNPDGDSCDSSTVLQGAYERAGYYNITVAKDGYDTWYDYDVEVDADECHVQTVNITANLVKQ